MRYPDGGGLTAQSRSRREQDASMIKKSVVLQAISPGVSAALKMLAKQLREAMPANWAGVDED